MRVLVPIVGFHRGGTSAAAGALHAAGFDFGVAADLMPPSPDNPKGYFEALPVVRTHDRLLRQLDGSWHTPALVPGWERTAPAEVARRSLSNWLSGLNGPGPFAVKDPRMTLFHGLWLEAARDAGFEMRPLCIWRPAEDVVASLRRRDKFTTEKARAVYAAYALPYCSWALYSQQPRTAEMHLSELLVDAAGCLALALEQLGLDPKAFDLDAADDFIDPELIHYGR